MGLRDAINEGLAEITEAAQALIDQLGLHEKIKNAVSLNSNHIDVNLPLMDNLLVIQKEMIRLIEAEGFEVEYREPCCHSPNPNQPRHSSKMILKTERTMKGTRSFQAPGFMIQCLTCAKQWRKEDKENLPKNFGGFVKILWVRR